MAVVPMKKVRLLVHSTDVDAALETVQRAGALEFRATNMEDVAEVEMMFPNAYLLPRIQHAVQFLKDYAPEVGLWKTLREGSQTVLSEKAIANHLQDTDAVTAVVDDLEALQVEFADKNEIARALQEMHDVLAEWKTLPIKLNQLRTARTNTFLLKGHQATEGKPLENALNTLCADVVDAYFLTPVNEQLVALTVDNSPEVADKIRRCIEASDVDFITLPEGTETPDVEFVAVSEKLAAAKSELALLHDQAEHFAITHYKELQLAAEVLTWQKERYAVLDNAVATKYTVVFDGWLMSEKQAEIEAEFVKKGIAAAFAQLEVEEGEQPPVEIQNSPFVQPFEVVTRLYGMPGYKDLDPTVFLAGFFFLFFGLSLTDVGYGLALVLSSAFILLFCKVAKTVRTFAKLLLFIGTSTVFVGMLFGGYLGFDPSLLPAPLQAIQMFDPIGNPLPVFYLALGLGVFQVMVGMLLKIYSDAKNGELMNGILDQGPWLLMFSIGILFVVTSVGLVDLIPSETIKNLALVAAVLIVLASGRTGEGVLGKVISAAAGLYAGVGHFSDILSYSRLLALGLATSALAFAINLIASMVVDVPYVGFLLAGLILLVGHLFTLAINTLGAFVHSARLQFVEFFGKFIAGTGKEFAPLARKETYITINDD